jgi:hypothetical protein
MGKLVRVTYYAVATATVAPAAACAGVLAAGYWLAGLQPAHPDPVLRERHLSAAPVGEADGRHHLNGRVVVHAP